MGVFNNWPYTDVHQLNLDFILEVAKEAQEALENIEQTTADAEAAKQEAILASTRAIRAAGDAEDTKIQVAQYYQNILQIGTPIVVQDSSDMTQYNRVYLYTGTEIAFEFGHWYYYDDNTGEWTDGGEYGVGSGITQNANNILKYILEHVAYTEPGMQTYVDALYQALAHQTITTYMVINALTHVTNSNTATGCNEGDSYTATLTADANYRLGPVTVTMGGRDITAAVYNNGQINITSVTGDITITAIGIGVPDAYTVYDYIYYNGSDNPSYVNDAIINTATYNDLQQLIFDFDFMPKISVTTSKSIIGARTSADNNGISFFGRTDTQRVSVFSHGAALGIDNIPDVAVDNVIHVNLNPHSASPSTLTVGSLNVSEAWVNSNVINTPVGYCGRSYPGGTSSLTKFAAVGTLRLYDLSDNLVSEYIPCVRNSDNVVGIYDTISEMFYTASTVTYATVGNVNCVWEVGNWS